MPYFNNHSHTEFSNLRLLDCINKPEALIDKAIEFGLTGIAITDHETLSAHMRVNKYAKKIKEQYPDFTIALGNEIYLTDTRDMGQKYYHFILIAKDEIGYKGLKELSSIAWQNSYYDRRLERVPTLKSELQEAMKRFKGHIIGTTACIGGELGQSILALDACEKAGDKNNAYRYHQQIIELMNFCIETFGENDFYVECAPSDTPEQIICNKRMQKIAECFCIQMCIGTDAHYLTKEDRYIHKAYLNSKGGEREVDSFYEFARLMTEEETIELLSLSYDLDTINCIFKNSNKMRESIQWFSLERHQDVVEVEVKNYPKGPVFHFGVNNDQEDERRSGRWKILEELGFSDNPQERYWVNECLNSLDNISLCPKYDYNDYLDRLEEEARVMKVIGEKLNTCIFAYPNTLKHYIDLFWECGSTVGAGRGSSCSGLNHYLLGITQLDPLEWELPYWRFLNDERVELPCLLLMLGSCK